MILKAMGEDDIAERKRKCVNTKRRSWLEAHGKTQQNQSQRASREGALTLDHEFTNVKQKGY